MRVVSEGKGLPVTLSGSSVDVAINDLANWTMVTQVGGYRPQFRPHRRVIETPGRYPCLVPAAFIVLAVSLIPAQDIHGSLRS
ncbi:hypothetical protein EMIT0P44_140068 [Pseudomonas sp. IT-P44]|nr:hypothetical protein ASC74_18605 [Pseudomonas sp. Root329]